MIQVKDIPYIKTNKIYGFTINEGTSDPTASVTYTDLSTGFTKGSSNWDNSDLFKDIRPCLFNNGAVVGYLQRNDYSKFENGATADITSGSAGDVMIEIPKMAYYLEKSGSVITGKIYVGDGAASVDSRYSYLPFSRDAIGDRDKIYVGAYYGNTLSNVLRSLSGKAPTVSQTLSTFRTQAQAHGTGYQQMTFYTIVLLQMLYILRYGNLNSQSALGRGYVDGNSAAINTGGTNAKGMFYGESTGKYQMKFAGIEDLWGNVRSFVDGLYCDSSRNILTHFKSFNNGGTGYTNQGQGATSDIGGYMTQAQGTTGMGFIEKAAGGSATTYYPDLPYLNASCIATYGGNWSQADYAGIFFLYIAVASGDSSVNMGARLTYV